MNFENISSLDSNIDVQKSGLIDAVISMLWHGCERSLDCFFGQNKGGEKKDVRNKHNKRFK